MSDAQQQDTYEAKYRRLEAIVKGLENSQTPIDALAKDVKEGAALYGALKAQLDQVEAEVMDAFQMLDSATAKNVATPSNQPTQ